MPVFDKLCCAAKQAEEKKLISTQLAERICRIGTDKLHFKHLGLELHGLIAQLAPAGGKGSSAEPAGLEELVRRIEEKHRRI